MSRVVERVTVFINQIYSEHEKYFILEVEVPATPNCNTRKIASVNVSYDNLKTHTRDRLSSTLEVKFTNSRALVESSVNRDVMIDLVELIATERNELATTLRDKGKIKEAKQMLTGNAVYLKSNAVRYKSKRLDKYSNQNEEDSRNLDEANWNRQRKSMRESQSVNKYQR